MGEIKNDNATITLCEQPAGTGKTTDAIAEATQREGITLFLMSSIDTINESKRILERLFPDVLYTEWIGINRHTYSKDKEHKYIYEGLCPRVYKEDRDSILISGLIEKNYPASGCCALCEWCDHDKLSEGEKKLYREYKQSIDKNIVTEYKPNVVIHRDNCSHINQFKDTEKIVLAPIEYLPTTRVINLEPEMIVLDDVTLRLKDIPKLDKIDNWVDAMNKYILTPDKKDKRIDKELDRINVEALDYQERILVLTTKVENSSGKLQKQNERQLIKIIEDYSKKINKPKIDFNNFAFKDTNELMTKLKLLNADEQKEIMTHFKNLVMNYIYSNHKKTSKITNSSLLVDPQYFLDWLSVWDIRGENREWKIPHIFNVFKTASENPDLQYTIIDAYIPHEIVKVIKDRVGKEIKLVDKPSTKHEPKTQIIYRMLDTTGNERAFSKGTVTSDIWIEKNKIKIQILMKHFIEKNKALKDRQDARINDVSLYPFIAFNVGIVTHKDSEDKYTNWLKQFGNYGFLHHGNVRGNNTLETVDFLFVIGTYSLQEEDILKEFKYFYYREPTTNERLGYDKDGNRYKDKDLDNFVRWKTSYEIYQSVHRARPYRQETIIVCFSSIPEWLKKEFTIKSVFLAKDKNGYYVTEDTHYRQTFFYNCIPDYEKNINKKLCEKFGITERSADRLITKMFDNDPELSIELKEYGSSRRINYITRLSDKAIEYENIDNEDNDYEIPTIDELEAQTQQEKEEEFNNGSF